MTDEKFPDDLESIAAAIPSVPETFGELYDLLHRVPQLTQPDIQQVRQAMLDSQQGSGGLGGGLSLVSSQGVGQETAGVIGVTPQIYFGMANMLADPTWDRFLGNTLSTVYAGQGVDYAAKYVLNSGTAPTTIQFDQIEPRQDPDNNPFNSALIGLTLSFPTQASNITVFLRDTHLHNFNTIPLLPVLLAGVRMQKVGGTFTNITSITVRMQIVDSSDNVLAESTPRDFLALGDIDDVPVINAWQNAPSAAVRWRVRIDVVKTSGATSGPWTIYFGEPQLQMTWTQQPTPFQPILGQWLPSQGDTMPTSGVPNMRHFFTGNDDPLEFYWDDVDALWKSTTLYQGRLLDGDDIPISANTVRTPRMPMPLGPYSQIFIERMEVTFFVNAGGTALGASHKWVGTFQKVDTANAATTLATVNIDSGSSAVWRSDIQSMQDLVDNADHVIFSMPWVKTGTPGNLHYHIVFWWRFVTSG